MISGIRGAITGFGPSTVFLESNGLEYLIHLPLNVFNQLQKKGDGTVVFLHIFHHFMQDEQRLFGFNDRGQREFFIAIKSIKGFGTILALSIMSHLDASFLLELCEKKDIKALCRIPRVGKSTAETLIFEIGRRPDRWKKILGEQKNENEVTKIPALHERELALQALLQLGYREKEIQNALEKLVLSDQVEHSASELIRHSLRIL